MTSTALQTLLVIAKRPVPGRVKTRLVPPFTPQEAADLAAAALRDTLAAASRVPATRHVLVFDGPPDGWVPAGWDCQPQASGGLDERLADAFATAGRGPTVLIGMDTPQFHPLQLRPFGEACLGLAADGGFWAIGFADPTLAPDLIRGVPMSTDLTGARQHERMAHLEVTMLDRLVDVDDAQTARTVAEAAPDTEFARRLRVLSGGRTVDVG